MVLTSTLNIYKVIDKLHMLWMRIWSLHHAATTTYVDPDWGRRVSASKCVGILPEGYIQNVPLPRVPRDQSTFQSRVPPVHTIPRYYEEAYVIPTYNSTCRIGERVA
jgi:hypothetical protein